MNITTNRASRIGLGSRALAAAALLTWAAPARPDSIASARSFIPAVHVVGDTGVFRTTVTVFNPDPAAVAEVKLYFTPADTDGRNLPWWRIDPPLQPRETVTMPDILANVLGLRDTYGALEVEGSVPLMVTSNTYNDRGGANGTLGNFSPGQPLRIARGFDDSLFGNLYMAGLPNGPDYRVNAALMNVTDRLLEAGVQLVDASGYVYGTRIYTVQPYSLRQINDLFNTDFAAFQPPPGNAWRLNVFVNLDNGAAVLSYATVTDKRTGDPYLIPGQPQAP